MNIVRAELVILWKYHIPQKKWGKGGGGGASHFNKTENFIFINLNKSNSQLSDQYTMQPNWIFKVIFQHISYDDCPQAPKRLLSYFVLGADSPGCVHNIILRTHVSCAECGKHLVNTEKSCVVCYS